jgi:MFS transporter, ACS family, tartrate transporter
MSVAPTTAEDSAIGMAAMSRVTRRLIPLLCLLFLVNYLDRTNVAMAKLRMLADAHLTDASYGTGTGLFFIGYFLFEVPSNLILQRVGARRWIARIMISWGIVSACMMFTRSPATFYLLRLALGVAEAGFFPGIVLYLTYWIPASHRTSAMAAFLTSTAISGLVGNPLGGWIMKMEGIAGLHGWQWLFLLEGILPMLLGIGILIFPLLPDKPADATWLTPAQRRWIEERLARDDAHPHVNHVADLKAAVTDGRLWLLSATNFMLIMGLYGFIYWVPTIVKMISGASDARVGLLSGIPYAVAAIGMVIIAIRADRAGRPRRYGAACALTGAIGMVILCQVLIHKPVLAWGLPALCLTAVGIFGALAPFWTIPTRYLKGTAAAGGIAIVNCFSALAGAVSPTVIGWTKQYTGTFTVGLLVVAAALALGAILLVSVPHYEDHPRS